MTAIAYAASATAQSATTTVTCTKPTGGTPTDIFVAHWSVTGNVADANMTLPSGWMQVAYLSPTGGPTVKLAYKVAVAGSEPSNYTFTLAVAALHTVGIDRWSNVDTSQLSDAYVPVTLNSATSGTSLTALDIVPESDNAMLIAAFANSTATNTAITVPAGFTTAHAITTNVRNTVAYASQTSAGHSSDKVATQAATAGWTAILWAMRPLDLGTPVTVTVSGLAVSTSKLELSVTLINSDLNNASTFRTNCLASMQGVYARLVAFIGGFGENDPLKDWNGTGAVPAIGSMFTAGIDRFIAVATALAIPIDWIIWRLPWQFTENPTSGIDSVAADYYGTETRRVRADRVVDYQTYIRRIGAYVISRGARRFKVGSELKGFQQDTVNGLAQTWDYGPYYTFFAQTADALLLAADDAGVSRSLILIGGAYARVAAQGNSNSNSVTFDSRITVTAPVQTIRYKDDAVPATWSMNNPGWAYPNKAPLQAEVEFLKLCNNGNTPVGMFSTDFGTGTNDSIIHNPDDFFNAEHITRDHARWIKRLLQDAASGRYASLPIDFTEYYAKPQSTIAQTNNTLLTDGSPVPGPFLPSNQWRPYFAALKAVALAVCVEEGATSPSWWSPFDEANGRTAPLLTGGQHADEQRWYGESFIHKGAAAEEPGAPAEGAITAVGLVNKLFNSDFASGTPIRAVTVSDSTKVYALPNMTKCLLVNKTAGRKSVSVNGHTVTLAPYDTQEVAYANAYTLTIAPAVVNVTGQSAKLSFGHKLTIAPAAFALTGRTVALKVARLLTIAPATVALSPQSVALKAARLLTIAPALFTLTARTVTLVKQPPIALILSPAIFALTMQSVNLIVTRKLTIAPATVTVTAQIVTLTVARKLSIAPATYALTGQTLTLTVARILTIAPAVYALTAQDVRLLVGHLLTIAPAVYTLTPQVVALLRGLLLAIAPATYALTPQAVSLIASRHLTLTPASFALTLQNVNLTYVPLGHYLLSIQTAVVTVAPQSVNLVVTRRISIAPTIFALTAGDVTLTVARRLAIAPAIVALALQDVNLTYINEPVIPLPFERVLAVPWENRTLVIEHESRVFVVSE